MRALGPVLRAISSALLCAAVAAGCGDDVEIGAMLPDGTGGSNGAGGAGGTTAFDGGACKQTPCRGATRACGNCEDDDGDGLVDMNDPDCLGPCHDSETRFVDDPEDMNQSPCRQDCFFDEDSGHGDDFCFWSHSCDPVSVAPAFPPEGPLCAYNPQVLIPGAVGLTCADLASAQSQTCTDTCLPHTPNGCDCFGCCELPGAPTTVWLGSRDLMRNPTCTSRAQRIPRGANPARKCRRARTRANGASSASARRLSRTTAPAGRPVAARRSALPARSLAD